MTFILTSSLVSGHFFVIQALLASCSSIVQNCISWTRFAFSLILVIVYLISLHQNTITIAVLSIAVTVIKVLTTIDLLSIVTLHKIWTSGASFRDKSDNWWIEILSNVCFDHSILYQIFMFQVGSIEYRLSVISDLKR